MAADADRKIRLFDATNGRPGNSYQVQDWTLHMEGDLNNPNIFYVLNNYKIYVFDKNMKKEVKPTHPALSIALQKLTTLYSRRE